MSFTSKLISGNKHRLCYLKAIDATGRAAWYFVLLDKAKLAAFSQLDERAAYDINDYGKILESGYGADAPQEMLNEINKKYDCEF